ncbi:MAG: M1 family metallopeptidase [Planctomycetes bacterium]|nr:M1 family metallopeptidase [Planctomycetota bacterium]
MTRFRSRALCVFASLVTLSFSLPAQEREDEGEGGARSRSSSSPLRLPGVRPDVTIFSPLDLPTPNALRTASGAPGPEYWQQEAHYRIEVALDPATREVRGRERITYVNHSPDALDYLWLGLEQNLLRADSIGTQIGAQRAVGGESVPSEGVVLGHVRVGDVDARYAVYDTQLRIELAEPLAPKGGQVELDLAWRFQVPEKVFRRYGTIETKKGTVWEIAQWFPAMCVYDDAHGWNTLPYLGTGEFYTNFGNYEVAITVPRDHLVVATGVLQNEAEVYTPTQLERLKQAKRSTETIVIRGEDEVGEPSTRPSGDGPLTWRFKAERVRTFAWASSSAFILDAASLDDCLIQSAYYAEAGRFWPKSTQMLRKAIQGYNERWFRYPYPAATNVAGVEGGMEYPMIIFCRGGNERGLYGVTTHEIGHNWFPMIVNTDERRHAWMDEGFNTFINIYSEAEYFGKEAKLESAEEARLYAMKNLMPIATPADRLDMLQLGLLQYQKTGLGLQILREYVLGEERFDFAFRTYIKRWAWKSPRPADFFRTMEDASGADLAWFWRGWFLENATLDQAVEDVTQASERRGARLRFANRSRMVLPLEFTVTYADGTSETRKMPVESWFRSDRLDVRLDKKVAVESVEIDAAGKLPDVDRKNNAWKRGE